MNCKRTLAEGVCCTPAVFGFDCAPVSIVHRTGVVIYATSHLALFQLVGVGVELKNGVKF